MGFWFWVLGLGFWVFGIGSRREGVKSQMKEGCLGWVKFKSKGIDFRFRALGFRLCVKVLGWRTFYWVWES